jgi:hypothetical protein
MGSATRIDKQAGRSFPRHRSGLRGMRLATLAAPAACRYMRRGLGV